MNDAIKRRIIDATMRLMQAQSPAVRKLVEETIDAQLRSADIVLELKVSAQPRRGIKR